MPALDLAAHRAAADRRSPLCQAGRQPWLGQWGLGGGSEPRMVGTLKLDSKDHWAWPAYNGFTG